MELKFKIGDKVKYRKKEMTVIYVDLEPKGINKEIQYLCQWKDKDEMINKSFYPESKLTLVEK